MSISMSAGIAGAYLRDFLGFWKPHLKFELVGLQHEHQTTCTNIQKNGNRAEQYSYSVLGNLGIDGEQDSIALMKIEIL